MAVLQSSNVRDLRQKFYELLTDFATFPAAQNFFLVNFASLPNSVLNEKEVNKLGIRPGNAFKTGLDFAKNYIFEPFFGGGHSWMFLATGVDLTTETTTVNNKGTLINGLLPVGPFMESREYPDNDLDIQFSETNISIIDSIFRSWIQLYSVYGNIGEPMLSTDVSIYFLSKQKSHLKNNPPSVNPIENHPGFSSNKFYEHNSPPLVTKIYTYKDCIPYTIKSANVGQYNGDVEIGSVAVGFRFSKYDVHIPANPEAAATPSDSDRPEWSDDYDGLGFGGNIGAGLDEARRADEIILRQSIPEEALKGRSGDIYYDYTGPQPYEYPWLLGEDSIATDPLTDSLVPKPLSPYESEDDSEDITTTHWTGIGVETPTVTDDPLKSFVPPNIQKGLRAGEDPKEEEDEDPGQ